jgi:hypothetical protein
MDEYSLASLLDQLGQSEGIDARLANYPSEYRAGLLNEIIRNTSGSQVRPVDRPTDIPLGMNPNEMISQAMLPYQGAPEGYVPTDFSGREYRQAPINIMGGGGSMENPGVKGFNYGGRVGTDIPLDEKVRLALGVSGVSTDVTFGQGQSWGGRANRADITGIDATLRDLARNREYGAEVKKDLSGNPFVSLLFKQRF